MALLAHLWNTNVCLLKHCTDGLYLLLKKLIKKETEEIGLKPQRGTSAKYFTCSWFSSHLRGAHVDFTQNENSADVCVDYHQNRSSAPLCAKQFDLSVVKSECCLLPKPAAQIRTSMHQAGFVLPKDFQPHSLKFLLILRCTGSHKVFLGKALWKASNNKRCVGPRVLLPLAVQWVAVALFLGHVIFCSTFYF